MGVGGRSGTDQSDSVPGPGLDQRVVIFPRLPPPSSHSMQSLDPKEDPPPPPPIPLPLGFKGGALVLIASRQAAAHSDPFCPAPAAQHTASRAQSLPGLCRWLQPSRGQTIGSQAVRSPGPHFWGDLFGTMAPRPKKAFSRGTRRHE